MEYNKVVSAKNVAKKSNGLLHAKSEARQDFAFCVEWQGIFDLYYKYFVELPLIE